MRVLFMVPHTYFRDGNSQKFIAVPFVANNVTRRCSKRFIAVFTKRYRQIHITKTTVTNV